MTDQISSNSTASVQRGATIGGTLGASTEASSSPTSRAPFGATLALTISAALGPFLVIAPLALSLIPSTPLPPPIADQHQDAETLLFVLAFAALLPAALIAIPRIADRIAAGPNGGALPALAATLTGALMAALLLAKLLERLIPGHGALVLGPLAATWCVIAVVLLGAASRSRPWFARWSRPALAPAIWALAGGLGLLLALAFADLGSISLLPLALGIVVVAVALLLRRRGAVPRLRRPWGTALDVALVVLLLLAVPNLVVFITGDPSSAIETRIIQFHQDFFLGPANQVLGGDALLVDTISQYGVGSIYLVAGWSQLAPIGNGTLGLLEGLLSALVFASAYAVLRIAGVSRPLAGGAMAVAVVALVYGLQYPLGALLQQGSIRFGLPIGIVLTAAVEARGGRGAGAAGPIALAIVGLSSIWALEAFAYTLMTALAILAVQAWLRPAPERRGLVLRSAAGIAAACVVAHVLLAGITLVASGELPDWGWYLNTLREFLVGEIGEVTYDFSPWSPGIAVGALYLASAAATVLLLRRCRALAERERVALVAIAGTTAYGIGLFSYLVNRSGDHIVPAVCLPAVLLAALWLSLLLRPSTGLAAPARTAALTSALAAGVLLVAVAWSSAEVRFPQSALAHAPPGGASLGDAYERLLDPPELFPGAAEGELLLARYMPGESRSVVLTAADLSVEILTRSQRASRLPFGDPLEDSFVPDEHLEPLGEAVADLEPGDRVLLDEVALDAFDGYRQEPTRDPLTAQLGREDGLASLQEWVLKEIGNRFRLRVLARGEDGLVVAELVSRPLA